MRSFQRKLLSKLNHSRNHIGSQMLFKLKHHLIKRCFFLGRIDQNNLLFYLTIWNSKDCTMFNSFKVTRDNIFYLFRANSITLSFYHVIFSVNKIDIPLFISVDKITCSYNGFIRVFYLYYFL